MPMPDNWIIENALKQLDKNKTDTFYAVHLSGQSLVNNKFTQRTIEILSNKNISHARLCFEITEISAILLH